MQVQKLDVGGKTIYAVDLVIPKVIDGITRRDPELIAASVVAIVTTRTTNQGSISRVRVRDRANGTLYEVEPAAIRGGYEAVKALVDEEAARKKAKQDAAEAEAALTRACADGLVKCLGLPGYELGSNSGLSIQWGRIHIEGPALIALNEYLTFMERMSATGLTDERQQANAREG